MVRFSLLGGGPNLLSRRASVGLSRGWPVVLVGQSGFTISMRWLPWAETLRHVPLIVRDSSFRRSRAAEQTLFLPPP